MANKHHVSWYTPGNTEGFYITSNITSDGQGSSLFISNNVINWSNQAGNAIVRYQNADFTTANWLVVHNATTGNPPKFRADSDTDTNVDVFFEPKGTGSLRFGTHTGSADAAVSGYITIKDAGGTVRKLAVIT